MTFFDYYIAFRRFVNRVCEKNKKILRFAQNDKPLIRRHAEQSEGYYPFSILRSNYFSDRVARSNSASTSLPGAGVIREAATVAINPQKNPGMIS